VDRCRSLRRHYFLLGVIIVIHWPVSGLYILGLFLAFDLIIAGASWIALGLGLRR
jgi:uncharacterized membrane protein HdeD (DUF308 family)